MPPIKHAVLGASSSHRWLACPPSARLGERLNARFGARSSPDADLGTKAHALGEIKVRYALWKADRMTAARHGEMTPAQREAYPGINVNRYKALRKDLGDIPEDLEKISDTYADVIMERLLRARESDPSAQLFLEQRLDYSRWVPSGFGTGDAIIVSDTLLDIQDLKAGSTDGMGHAGKPVPAHDNPQMKLYALGSIARFSSLYDFRSVRMTIIQPRLNSLDEDYSSVDELLRWAEEVVTPAAKLAWAGEGEFNPGDHCYYCPAKAVCAARAAQSLKVFDYGLAGSGELSTEQISSILPMLDEAEAWIKDLRTYAETCALQGERFTGYKLVRGRRPNKAWTDEDGVRASLLRAGYGPENYEKTVLRSPSEVQKMLGAKAYRSLIEEAGLVRQGEGRPTLVPESDSRPEYNSAEAAFEDMADPASTDK